ncbi:hypothetical protein EV363DRAFT_1200505 [Boletus edulis]|nr:hypothetical protein EV363DRAFT_1200505 [Boletus edulis]
MPPKSREKAEKPEKKVAKGRKAKDTDGGGRGDTRAEDQVAEELHDLEDRARKAFLGYARTDLFKRNITFGKYNVRLLNHSHRRRLYESFKSGGLQRFSVNNAIPLIIRSDDVVSTSVCTLDSQTVAKRDGSHLPWLELKGETLAGDKYGTEIVAAGGRHRRSALDEWFNDRKRGVAIVEKEMKDLQAQSKSDAESVSVEELRIAAERIVQANRVVEMGGSWIVEVYDADLVDTKLGLHLSSNQRLYVYAETAEEGVIQTFKTLIASKQDWKNIPVVTGLRSTSQRYRINSLLTQDYVWRLFLSLLGMSSTHYIHSDIFKISSLTTNLMSPHGGMLAAATIFLEDRLRMCFNAIPWDAKKVSQTMDIVEDFALAKDEDDEIKAANVYLYRCVKRLANATPVMDAIQDEIRDTIEAIYQENFGEHEKWKYFGTGDTVWKTRYNKYVKEVLEELEGIVAENLGREEHREALDDVKMAWKDCVSKASLVLKIKGAPDHAEFMPFMSVSVWKDMNEQLKRVPRALTEISAWFSPLLYSQKIVGRKWKVVSATADMLRGVAGHPDIADEYVLRAQKMLVWALFSRFGALLRMDQQMGEINMPPRPEFLPTLREYMLLDGPHKVETPWKSPDPIQIERDPKDTEDSVVLKEYNLEVHVVDDFVKNRVSSSWAQQHEVPWLSRWYRTTQIQPISKEIYRTLPLIAYHTHSFGKTKEKSEARWRKETIIAAIYEYCAIQRYRVPLLTAKDSAAAFIRHVLDSLLTFTLNEGKGALSQDGSRTLTWPDAIIFDAKKVSLSEGLFDICDENARSSKIITQSLHSEWIQKVVRAVEACPAAWPVVAGESLTPGKSRAVSKRIAVVLDELIVALANNSERHRDLNYDEEDEKKEKFANIEEVRIDATLSVNTLHKSSGVDKGKSKAAAVEDEADDGDEGDDEGDDDEDGEGEGEEPKPPGLKTSVSKVKADAAAKAQMEERIFSCLFSPFKTNAILSKNGQKALKREPKSKQLKLDASFTSGSPTVAQTSQRPDTSPIHTMDVQDKEVDIPAALDAVVDENMGDTSEKDSTHAVPQDDLDMDTDGAPSIVDESATDASKDVFLNPPFTQREPSASTSDDDINLSEWEPTQSPKASLVPTQLDDDTDGGMVVDDNDGVHDRVDSTGDPLDSITDDIRQLDPFPVDTHAATPRPVVPVQKRITAVVSPPRAQNRMKRARINTAGESSKPPSLPPPLPQSSTVSGPSSSSSRPPPRRILRRHQQRTSPPRPIDESEDADLLDDALNAC